MAEILKAGKVEFSHIGYSGEVEIRRGDQTMTVPFAALEKLIAEKVRTQAIARIESLSPPELLALATKK
jgi:hypothetical protein